MTTSAPRYSLNSLVLFVVGCAVAFGAMAWHRRVVSQCESAAQAERDRAEANAMQARAAVDAMLTQVASQEMTTRPTDGDLKRELLASAKAFDGADKQLGDTELTDRSTPPPLLLRRMKEYLDSVPAIDTHNHLWPFDQLPGYVETDRGRGLNLSSIWRNSYYTWINPITAWKPGGSFDDWWALAKHDFVNARATSFYRYQLPALKDLYGVDFERITDDEARAVNDRIFENYRDQKWLYHVVTERANIELMFNDPYWARFEFKQSYPWEVIVFNVTTLVRGFHPSEFSKPADDPYHFAREHDLKLESLDDYLVVLDRLFQTAKARGAVCLKTTLAYQRTLDFANVLADRAARSFGRPKSELSAAEIKDFEDFIMWRLVELSAKYELPFQIHTGQARIQGSNPMLLVDLIEANPKTKFILFHGGYPWVGETGAIVMRHGRHVWIDSVWLPTISFTMAKRAYHEWLEVMPSDRIMWGADCNHGEGIYGATEFTRRCLADVLAEKIERGELLEEHAQRIGQQILRDNALALFPQLKDRLWKHNGPLAPPE
jgi:predicted TIM-barrel fold metal-dependent hydrolase